MAPKQSTPTLRRNSDPTGVQGAQKNTGPLGASEGPQMGAEDRSRGGTRAERAKIRRPYSLLVRTEVFIDGVIFSGLPDNARFFKNPAYLRLNICIFFISVRNQQILKMLCRFLAKIEITL